MSATLADLQAECSSPLADYDHAKYLHKIPTATVVRRGEYILALCQGNRVLSLGGSGPLEQALRKVAREVYSVDRVPAPFVRVIDLDVEPEKLSGFCGQVDLVLCGEVLEHLSNPGRLLDQVRALRLPAIVTAPNAFTTVGSGWLKKGIENVNSEHVAWYSYQTLRTLLVRHGFEIVDFHWYNGQPFYAEGLIFYVR